jgi:hypothetical protein
LQELGATEVVELRLTEERVQFAPPPELKELLEQNPLVDELLPVR